MRVLIAPSWARSYRLQLDQNGNAKTREQYAPGHEGNSWYGKAEAVATGASTPRTKRTAFHEIKRFWQLHRVPNNA